MDSPTQIRASAAAMLVAGGAALAQIDLRAPVDHATLSHPSGIACGDFDLDGDDDLAVATRGAPKVSVLVNLGDGTFSGPLNYPIDGGLSVGHTLAVDLDGDADLDLALALTSIASVRIMVNSGGSFLNGPTTAVGGAPIWIEGARLDADDDVDLVVVTDSGTVCTLFNRGHGKLDPVTINIGGDLRGAAPGDFDQDGDPDLAVTNHIDRTVRVLSNNGNGVFTPTSSLSSPGMRPEGIVSADLDGDGDLDLAATTGVPKYGYVMVYTNNGGGFSGPASFATSSLDPTTIAAGDLDSDGDIDLVTTNEDSGDISALANNGDGTFAGAVVIRTGDRPERLAMADFDSNGGLDLAVANFYASTTSVLLNNTGSPPCDADLDGSGVLDFLDFLVFVNLFNAGDPGADFNGDGVLDLFDFLAFTNLFGLGC